MNSVLEASTYVTRIWNAVVIIPIFICLLVLTAAVMTELTYSSDRLGTIVFAAAPPPPLGERNYDIFVSDGTGQNWLRLTDDPAEDAWPVWSPDGTKIAFVSHRDGNTEIYVMDANGENQTNLSSNPDRDDEPSWSPDSKRIAFRSRRNVGTGIFAMDADGNNLEMIVIGASVLGYPAWSPDGGRIAFDKGNGICVVDVDGGNETVIIDRPAYSWYPAWSPDGSMIAFCSDRDGNWEIYVMKADGSDQRRLTDSPINDLFPAWTSDGRIIFNSGAEVHIIDSNGGNQELLMAGAIYPDWFVPGPGYYVEHAGKLRTTWGRIKQ